MKSRLNIENPFFEMMGRLGDIMIVNILFLVCSLPVVTAGTSVTAMYHTFQEMADGRGTSAVKGFFGAWKKYRKQSFSLWLVMLAAGALLVFDLLFLGRAGQDGPWSMVSIGIGCLLLLWEMIFAYLFPVLPEMAEEGIRGKAVFQRSLYLAAGHFPVTALMILLNIIPAACMAASPFVMALAVPVYMVVGFGLTGYLNTWLLRRCGVLPARPLEMVPEDYGLEETEDEK